LSQIRADEAGDARDQPTARLEQEADPQNSGVFSGSLGGRARKAEPLAASYEIARALHVRPNSSMG